MRSLIRSNTRGLGIVVAMTLLMLAILELRHPFYFLQDDGLEYFLPSYAHNWFSLLSGQLPLYNFHTFGGLPHASMGQPAVFYFPEYIALFLSRVLWGNLFATIDILATTHLVLGACGTYLLLRHFEAEKLPASFAALTALSGFALWCGRMWPIALVLCAWFPWTILAALRFFEKPGMGRGAWLVFFRLGLLYGGYPQFFVLAIIFEHLFMFSELASARKLNQRSVYSQYFLLNIATMLLGLPFLLPMAVEMQRSFMRSRPLPFEVFSALGLTPLSWIVGQGFFELQLPAKESVAASLPYLSHIGLVASLLSFFGIALLSKKEDTHRLPALSCVICFVFALLWSWNLLSHAIYHLPLLNRLTGPFKLVFFAGFFQCILAALALDRLSTRWHYPAIVGFIAGWVWVFCFLPGHAWRVREYHPPLASPWSSELSNGRYLVIGNDLIDDTSSQFVAFNYSELWGFDNLLGYEPLVSQKDAQNIFDPSILDLHAGTYFGPVNQRMLDRVKIWSVKYLLVSPRNGDVSAALRTGGFRSITTRAGWTLWEDPNPKPRIRWDGVPDSNASSLGLNWSARVNSIDISLNAWPARTLVLAFTSNPNLHICIENRCKAIESSPDGFIHIPVPIGTQRVRLVYRNPPFVIGVAISAGTLVLLIWFWIYSNRRKDWIYRALLSRPSEPSEQVVSAE